MKTKLLLMLVAVMLMAGLAQANMIVNPGFEDGVWVEGDFPDFWAPYSVGNEHQSWLNDSAGAHSGSKYMIMWNPVLTGGGFTDSWTDNEPVVVVAGKEYAFSIWAKGEPGNDSLQAKARITWRNDLGQPLGTFELDEATDIDDEWDFVDLGTRIAPAWAESCVFTLLTCKDNATKNIMFDDVDMRIASITDADPPGGTRLKDSYGIGAGQDEVLLTWTNMDPNSPATDVYVDVWFGHDPNRYETAGWTKIIDANDLVAVASETSIMVDIPLLDPPNSTTYYWQVISYPDGAAGIDVDHKIDGPTLEFIVLSEQPAVVVIDTNDMVTWIGRDIDIVADMTDDGESPVTIEWTTPDMGVAFDPSQYVLEPTVSFTFIGSSYVNALIKSPSFEFGMAGWETLTGSSENWDGGYDGTYYVTPSDGGALASVYSSGTGEDGVLSQKLIETLAADTDYELTVDIVNAGYPYTDPPARADYKVQLLAGDTVLVETYNDPPVITKGVWATDVTLEHTSGPGSDPNVGEQLEIRLIATDNGEVSFDNVRLTADPGFPIKSGYSYSLTLTATDGVGSKSDSITVDVYDDACQASRIALGLGDVNPGDLVGDSGDPEPDCDTDLFDVAAMAVAWVTNSMPTEAIVLD